MLFNGLAIAYHETGQMRKCVETLRQSLALDPNQPAANLVFGRISEPLFAGASPYHGAYLDGALDDLRVYNWALPSSEIDKLAGGYAGINYQYYEGTWDVLPNFDALPVVESGAVPNVTDMGFL